MQRLAVVAILTGGALSLFAGDQTLILRDGRSVSGSMVSGNSRYVIFRDDNGVRRRFDVNQIQSLDFNTNSGYYNQSGAYNGTNNGAYNNGAYNNGQYGNNYPYRANRGARAAGAAYTLPAGTEVSVRTNQEINSETATTGQRFGAEISQDVIGPDGQVIIPRGSPAALVIREVRGGGITGSPTLALDLQSVSVNGRNYLVSTEDVNQSGRSGLGANRRTAEMVGGGAALGTLLGAIAGGGKGAAIGALAGAALGGTAQVLTRGKTVQVPAETQLTFRLDQPIYLQAY